MTLALGLDLRGLLDTTGLEESVAMALRGALRAEGAAFGPLRDDEAFVGDEDLLPAFDVLERGTASSS